MKIYGKRQKTYQIALLKGKMMKNIISKLVLSCLMAVPLGAAAASACDSRLDDRASMYHSEMSDLLKGGDFQRLEESMKKNYEEIRKEGNGDHLFYLAAFFTMTSRSGNKGLAEWKRLMPAAFFSNYVSGMKLMRDADEVRVGRSADAMSSKDMEAIRNLQQAARDDFVRAKSANSQRAIVDAALITIDATENGPAAIVEQLKKANSSDPMNVSARLAAINYLAPRWGGSFAAMDDVVKQAKTAGLPKSHVEYLTMALENTKASHFEIIEQNVEKAQEHYRKAYDICNKSNFAIDGLERTGGR